MRLMYEMISQTIIHTGRKQMLWLAIDREDNSLGVVEAQGPDDAFYKFSHMQLYPAKVILLPANLLIVEEEDYCFPDDGCTC